MLEEKRNEKRISLPRFNTFDRTAFEIVLRYIHTGRISEKNLTINILFDIIKIANQLELIDLSQQIAGILTNAVNIGNVGVFYQTACDCNDTILIDKCEKFIYNNLEILVQNKNLLNLSKTQLEQIIEKKPCTAFDFDIFKLVYQWHKTKNQTSIEQNLVKTINFDDLSICRLNNILKSEYSELIDDKLRLQLMQILITKLSDNYLGINRLASGSNDNSIKIWNLNSGECIKTLNGHTSVVRSLQLLANNRLASGSDDKSIKIWNLDSGECLKTLSGHTNYIYSLHLLAKNRLASGSNDNLIKIWNLDSGECIKTLTGHTSAVWSLQLCANNRLASGSNDNSIKIWNLDSGECLKTLTGHTSYVRSLQFLANEKFS